MKKQIFAILALVLALSGCSDDSPEATSATSQISASQPVDTRPAEPAGTKTIYVRTCQTQSSGESVTRRECLLDENNLVYQVVFYTNDAETMRYDVENDENGNYIRWVSEHITCVFHYDQQGRYLGKSVYAKEQLISSMEYTWENGNPVSLTDTNGTQEQRTAWFYNESGQKVREEMYQNGVLVNYSQITPDEQGRALSQDVYLADGTLHSTVSYLYEGAVCTATTTLTDGTVEQRTEYTYDEQGNLLSTTVYSGDGQMISQVVDTWKAIQVPVDSLRASI